MFDAKLDYVESTYGNSVLDLQSNKVDLAFALNPTPQRALSIGFTHPMIIHPFGCIARKGLDPKTWDDINKPEIRIVYRHRLAARDGGQALLLQGAAHRLQDARRMHAGAAVRPRRCAHPGGDPRPVHGRQEPLARQLSSADRSAGRAAELSRRAAGAGSRGSLDVINAWIDFNRGTGQIREWLLDGLAQVRRHARADPVDADLLNGHETCRLTSGTSPSCCATRRCSGRACWSRWPTPPAPSCSA